MCTGRFFFFRGHDLGFKDLILESPLLGPSWARDRYVEGTPNLLCWATLTSLFGNSKPLQIFFHFKNIDCLQLQLCLSGSCVCPLVPDPWWRCRWGGSEMKGPLSLPWQAEMDMITWGVDPASVEQHIGSHRSIHNAIGDYRWQLDKIKADLVLWNISLESLPRVYSRML